MSSNGTTTTERPVEDGRRDASPTRGWIALGVLLAVYAVGAVGHLDPTILAGLLPGH